MGPVWPWGVPKWYLIGVPCTITMGPTKIGHYIMCMTESGPFTQTRNLHRAKITFFWEKWTLFLASRAPKCPEIGLTFMISMWYTCAGCFMVFFTSLKHLATQVGFSPSEGQLFSSDSDPTWIHFLRAKCIIGHMRPALFLVYFCSKFMVLVSKRLKIRVIASNLQKCGKKCPFWT